MKNTTPNQLPASPEWTARKPYTKPEVKRVDLALAETLSTACKLDVDPTCVGPIVVALLGGS